MCDGPMTATVSAAGECCVNGVKDADGLCCASGNLDSLGVCDGGDATGKQVVSMAMEVPAGYTASDLADATSTRRRDLDAALSRTVADSLSRSPSTVEVVGYTLQSRRELSRTHARELAAGLTAVINLLPTGTPNNVPLAQLSTLITTGAPTSPLVSILGVLAAHMEAVCGNDVCETGERPRPSDGFAGCSADCKYPVGTCPSSNGVPCNGVGLCSTGSSGVGVCTCSASQGYAGQACDVCASGFASDSGRCVRVVGDTAATPPSQASTSGGGGGGGPAIAGIVGGVVAAVVAVVAIVALVKWKQQRGRMLKPTDIRVVRPQSRAGDRKSSRVAAFSQDDVDMSETDEAAVRPRLSSGSVAPDPITSVPLSPNSRRDRVKMAAQGLSIPLTSPSQRGIMVLSPINATHSRPVVNNLPLKKVAPLGTAGSEHGLRSPFRPDSPDRSQTYK
jgi:hypothetical protein